MQATPPELPPMQPMTPLAASPPPPSQPSASAPKAAVGGTKRLRQAVAMIGGGGLGLVAIVCAGQLALRPGLRPADLMATIEAQTDIGIFNQKMGVAPGQVEMTEAQYRAKLAEAERSGQAKAELAYQKDLAVVQADKERVLGAYQTLYQRTNIIAQAGVQMEAQALQFRQQLITQTNGGRVMVISIYDGLCALGDADSCAHAREARKGMIDESTTLTEGRLAQKVNELMAGIEDPAAFVTREDRRQHGTPALTRR